MRTKHVKQVIAGCFSLGLLGAAVAQAAGNVCEPTSSTGAVFSVLPDGLINANVGNSACNFEFYNTEMLGGNYSGPSNGCKVYDLNGPTTDVVKGGSAIATGPVLPEFSESPETFSIAMTIDSLTVAGRPIAMSDFDSNNKLTRTVGGSTFTIEIKGSFTHGAKHSYVFSGGDYGSITMPDVTANQFGGIEFSGPIRARKLTAVNCANAADKRAWTFAADNEAASPEFRRQNYINEIDFGNGGCGIKVPGTKTTINVLGKPSLASTNVVGLTFPKSGACFNFRDEHCGLSGAAMSYGVMNAQEPSWLQINVYNGNVNGSDRIAFAGGLYVPNGDYILTGASETTIVGNILAKNITLTQGNTANKFFSHTIKKASLQNKYYSLTPPVSDRVLKTGDYIYRATQRDFRSDGVTKGTSGHLMAFAMKADSSHDEVPVWDAADRALMVDRADRIKTENAGWATSADDFKTLDSTYSCVIDPRAADCRKSNDPRDPESLVGVPWRTAPIIVGKSVLFATDDGILYSINKSNGKLNWGWIPSQILARTVSDTRVNMASQHSWGQIGTQTVVSTDGTSRKLYVMGSALGGQLHFSIEVSDDGDALKNVAWVDYQADSYSPGALTKNFDGTSDNSWPGREGRPHGGAAPVGSFVDGAIKAAYITGDKLFVRNVDGSDSAPVGKSLVFSGVFGASAAVIPSSNLLYMNDSQIYFGAANGTAYQASIDGSVSDVESGINKLTLGTDPIWHINGSRLVSGSGSALMLTAQTKRRVNVLKYAADKWALAWWTGLSATGEKESSSATAEQIPVTAADDAQITAPASIRNGQIILYYTKGVSGCSPEAYSFGPLYLEDGRSALSGAQFRFKDATSLSNYLGVGQATGGNDVIVNGKDGVLAGSSGTTMESGNTGILTNSGADNRKRLNWRELTNFF